MTQLADATYDFRPASLSTGTVGDATQITAPSSSKNQEAKRDPDPI